jgi:hypothetical protein
MRLRCKDCGCVISISDQPLPNRTEYYCQGCGEDKKIYEIYEDTTDNYLYD